jgi:hypothetical protein
MAWFARDDLRPLWFMCLRMGWRLLTRPLARAVTAPKPGSQPHPDHPAGPRLRRGRSKAARMARAAS